MSETNETDPAIVSQEENAAQLVNDLDPSSSADQTLEIDTEPNSEPLVEEDKPKPARVSPAEKRIEQLLKREREAREELARYKAAASQPNVNHNASQAPDGYVPASDVVRLAAEQVAAESFAKTCNDIAEIAMVNYGDEFDSAYKQLGQYAEPEQVASLLETIVGLDLTPAEAAALYVKIGNDPDEITRLVSMPEKRRDLAIAKMALQKTVATPPPVSKAPAPIRPIAAKVVAAETDPSKLTGRAFQAWLDAEEAKYSR